MSKIKVNTWKETVMLRGMFSALSLFLTETAVVCDLSIGVNLFNSDGAITEKLWLPAYLGEVEIGKYFANLLPTGYKTLCKSNLAKMKTSYSGVLTSPPP